MTPTSVIDANIILRFLLGDHPELSKKAKKLFTLGEKGQAKYLVDEVVVAEVVWVLESFYKIDKGQIAEKLEKLFGQDWIIIAKKSLVLSALSQYRLTSLSYIDCWIIAVATSQKYQIKTFDKKLATYAEKI